MKTTGKTVNIPKLEISAQERAENKLTPKALMPGHASYARQDWLSSKAFSRAIG